MVKWQISICAFFFVFFYIHAHCNVFWWAWDALIYRCATLKLAKLFAVIGENSKFQFLITSKKNIVCVLYKWKCISPERGNQILITGAFVDPEIIVYQTFSVPCRLSAGTYPLSPSHSYNSPKIERKHKFSPFDL